MIADNLKIKLGTSAVNAVFVNGANSLNLDFINQKYSVCLIDESFANIFTFTRASAATRVNPLGVIESVAANLPCIDHSPVNLATGTGVQTLALAKDRTYAITAVGGTVVVTGAGVNVAQMGAASGVIQTPAGSGTVDVTFTPAGGPTALHVREVLGLSVWEQRTNLFTHSSGASMGVGIGATNQGITTSVVGSGVEDGISFIDVRFSGTPLADQMSADGNIFANSGPRVAGTAGALYSIGFNARIVSGQSYVQPAFFLCYETSGSVFLSLAPVVSTNNSVSSIAKNRKTITNAAPANTAQMRVALALVGLIVGTPVDVVIRIGGAQLEAGAFPSPYIPTAGAQVTRAADLPTEPLTPWFNPVAGTVVWRGFASLSSGKYPCLFQFDDGSNQNALVANVDSVGTISFYRILGGVYAGCSTAGVSTGSKFKVALSWDASNLFMSLNGGPVVSSPHSGLPSVNRLMHGNGAGGALNGDESSFKYLKKTTTGAALQALTA